MRMKTKLSEKLMKAVFLTAACVSIFAVLLICAFLLANGVPAIGEIGAMKFLVGTEWKPGSGSYGVLPMIIGSVYVTAGATLVGVPVGVLCAVFMARFCPRGLRRLLKSAVDLLAGIPSIIYGFFGMMTVVPIIGRLTGTSGKGILTASVLLGMMILPTVISTTESALSAVPDSYYEGALALGATHERSVFRVVLPAARSGTLAGVVLGIGRAIGEAMAVYMVAGNQAVLPSGIFSGVRTLTANIVLEMGYATDLHRRALIATAVVLFVFVMIINLSFSALRKEDA